MKTLHEPEIIRAVNGLGWTVVRCGRDEEGAFQEWIGENYEFYEEAQKASSLWENKKPLIPKKS